MQKSKVDRILILGIGNILLADEGVGVHVANYLSKEKRQPLRFRDLRLILNFIKRIYNDYFIVWLD